MGHLVETCRQTNMKYFVAVALSLAACAVAEPEASAEPGYNYYGYRYPSYRYGYGHYGKRSAEPSRHPQPKSVAPYLHYDLGRKLGYFAYRGYPQGPAPIVAHPVPVLVHKRSADADAEADPGHYGYYGYVNYGHRGYYGYSPAFYGHGLYAPYYGHGRYHYGKRDADAEAEAGGYSYYGYRYPHYGYGYPYRYGYGYPYAYGHRGYYGYHG